MKSRTWMWTAAVTLCAALAMTVGVAAQDNAAQNSTRKHHHYKLIEVDTFGGPRSYLGLPPSRVLTNHGTLVGWAETKDSDPFEPNCLSFTCNIQKSFTWHDERLTQLPALASNASSQAYFENDHHWITGFSETGSLDPNLGTPQFAAVLWRNDQITDLGTLGGASSFANAVNNRGEVVGNSSNGVADDPFSMQGDNSQTRAFVWVDGLMFDLGTLGGPDSTAFYNNDKGQVVGISYPDDVPVPALGGFPATATFLWEHGEMKNIGGLGGHFTFPLALNQRGEIVGWSLLAGDQVNRSFIWQHGSLKDMGDLGGVNVYVHTINEQGVATGYSDIPAGTPVFGHPFLWKNGHMRDLGAPPTGSNCANGEWVNTKEQVVGTYGCGQGGAFIAEYGLPPVDLNTLVVPGTKLRVFHAFSINDRGEIACEGARPNEDDRACLLVPLDDDQEWCDEATAGMPGDSSLAPRSQASPKNTPENSLINFFRGGMPSRSNLPIPNRSPLK